MAVHVTRDGLRILSLETTILTFILGFDRGLELFAFISRHFVYDESLVVVALRGRRTLGSLPLLSHTFESRNVLFVSHDQKRVFFRFAVARFRLDVFLCSCRSGFVFDRPDYVLFLRSYDSRYPSGTFRWIAGRL